MLGVLAGMSARAEEPQGQRTVEKGELLARLICSNCHIVADDQHATRLIQPTPSFREIANRPGTNEKSLRHFLATTHWDAKTVPVTMPDLMLTKEQNATVIRYLMSLRLPSAARHPTH